MYSIKGESGGKALENLGQVQNRISNSKSNVLSVNNGLLALNNGFLTESKRFFSFCVFETDGLTKTVKKDNFSVDKYSELPVHKTLGKIS